MSEGEAARGSFAIPGSNSDAASAEGDHVPKNIFLTGGAGEYFATCFAAHNLRFFFVMESFPPSAPPMHSHSPAICANAHTRDNIPSLVLLVFSGFIASHVAILLCKKYPQYNGKFFVVIVIYFVFMCRLVYWLLT